MHTGCDSVDQREVLFLIEDIETSEASGEVNISLNLDQIEDEWLHPRAEAININVSGEFQVFAYAKSAVGSEEWVWVELYIGSEQGVKDIQINASSAVRYWTVDPFSEDTFESFSIGSIIADGLSRVVIGLPKSAPSVDLSIKGETTDREARNSSPLAVTPDGSELWSVFGDGDLVAVIDTENRSKVAEIPLAGRPSSLSITADGTLVLVVCREQNMLHVIDRMSRQVVQSFSEAEGIGRDPRHVVTSADGSHAYVSAYVGEKITALSRYGNRFEISAVKSVGRRPTGLSLSPDGSSLYVSHFLPRGPVKSNEGWVSTLSAPDLERVVETPIHDHFNLKDAKCVANAFNVHPSRMTSEGAPSQLSGVFLTPSGHQGWTPGTRVAGAAIVWERGENANPDLNILVEVRPGEISPPFLFIFDTSKEETEPLLAWGHERPIPQEYPRCARFQQEIEFVSRDIRQTSPNQQVNRFLAFPTGAAALSASGIVRHLAFSKGGRVALIVSYTADELAVYDASTHHPLSQKHLTLSGSNPNGIAVSPNGREAWVAYDNSPFVSLIDLDTYSDPSSLEPNFVPYKYDNADDVPQTGAAFGSSFLIREISEVLERPPLSEVAQVELGEDPVDAKVRRGRALFNSGNPDKYPTLSMSRNGACASCHPDGGTDGSAWGTMEGERRTMSLRGGVNGRGWLHASATHENAYEFAEIIVTERLGGELSEEDLEALADYLGEHIPEIQRPVVDEALAERGAELFSQNCTGCHAGEKHTSGDTLGLYNVGTATDNAQVVLGSFFEALLTPLEADLLSLLRGDRDLGPDDPVGELLDFRPRPVRSREEFKAPALVNVYDSALFFHDGRFSEISEVVGYFNEYLKLNLSDEDTLALIEYLKTL